MPARGSMLRDPEKVPIHNRGRPSPNPNANKRKNPIRTLPKLVTKVSNSKSPGDKQGEAIVPLTAPNINAVSNEPPCSA